MYVAAGHMRGHVYNDMHLFQWMHSEPQGTTLAVNYIMPFNSSTPKIDGYYISSILATEKRQLMKAHFWPANLL